MRKLREFAAAQGMQWVLDEVDEAIAIDVPETRTLRQTTNRQGLTTYEDVTEPDGPPFPGQGRGRRTGRSVGLWPGLFGEGEALPGPLVEFCQHQVGSVELVAGVAEVLADGPEAGAPAGAVCGEPGGLGVVRVGAGAGVDAQLGLERLADRSGLDEVDQAPGEDGQLRPARAHRAVREPPSSCKGPD